MEDIDGGLHPAVDGQSLDEDEDKDIFNSIYLDKSLQSVASISGVADRYLDE